MRVSPRWDLALERTARAGNEEADARVERSLYQRAVGYSFNSEKILCNKNGEVTRVPIVEHVPPDVLPGMTSLRGSLFWLFPWLGRAANYGG